jgi:NADH-quinone oxidoreductase subunit E
MTFSEITRDRARQIIARYPESRSRSALLPILHLVQAEEGFVSPDGIGFCAEVLGLTKAEVSAVATFYTMYKRRPTGDWLVSVCTNTMCGVLGGNAAYEALTQYLGVGHDETTSDGKITLEHAECLAACDYAPVMTVNYEFFDKVDADTALGLVKQLQNGQRPQPHRGARLCTLKEMAIQLAGFADDREGAVGDGPAGEPTLAGNRLAERYGVAVPGFDPETPIKKPDDSAGSGPGNVKPATAPKAASDGKPAGDGPLPQKKAVT